MTNYLCKFNYRGEVTELKTEANGHYQAILRCLAVMARRYGVSRQSMINYFTADRLNNECKEVGENS